MVEQRYAADAELILSHRQDLGADFWTTPDRRLLKGSPFSAWNSALLLLELGMKLEEPVLRSVAELFFGAWREDGRFKLSPQGAIYPCHTIHAAYLLCEMGYAFDERIQKTFRHLLDTQYCDGGWRCNKFSFGRGPETEFSNPHPTLVALGAFRHSAYRNREPALDRAVDFLLEHWRIRKPIGPCHYGIGTLFMQTAYPFGDYNLFFYVYLLSFYDKARGDERFLEAFRLLESKLSNGQIVVERVVPKLAKLDFCRKGAPSLLATGRFREIVQNLGGEAVERGGEQE